MNPNALLVAEGIAKHFQKKNVAPIEVLRHVSLDIFPSDSIAIIGKSGTGKSTLLHILGTLVKPTEGRVFFLGQDILRFDENKLSHFRNHEIGFVFQFHYLLFELSALENVMIPALIAGKSSKVAKVEAEKLLERVGLGHRIQHRPSELSGGEQQRVAIARSLIMKPKILFTDEMTGNLDPETGTSVFDLVFTMHREYGTALVSVTHDEMMAARYNRRLKLVNGQLTPVS